MLPSKFRFICLRGFRGEYVFRNRPIRNKNCLWWPCLLTDQYEMCNLYRELILNVSCQVSVQVVLEEKIKMGKVNGRRTLSDGKSSHCLFQGELKTTSTIDI